MEIVNKPAKDTWDGLCLRPQMNLEFLEGSVKNILSRVKTSGDAALRELTLQFDKTALGELKISGDEVNEGLARVRSHLKNAIALAASNIEKFHSNQKREVAKIETTPCVICWRQPQAIQKIGIYIPGGSAPLFSTVLMLGIPA